MIHPLQRFFQGRWSGFTLVAGVLLVWQIAAERRIIDPVFIPPVSDIAHAWVRALADGTLADAVISTLRRFVIGYTLAGLLGTTLGVLLGSSRTFYALLEPPIELLRPLPSPAIVPVFILFLGIEDRMKIAVVVFAASFPIIVNTVHGVRSVDRILIDTARTFGYRRLAVIRRITLPAALPAIVTGMRISLAVALIVTVVAEMLAGDSGLGFYVLDTERAFAIPDMYAGIFTLAALGYSLNWAFITAERFALRWYGDRGQP